MTVKDEWWVGSLQDLFKHYVTIRFSHHLIFTALASEA